ncbi:NmrA family NAD(P)-binding protein [Flavobacterium silvaticum]|uniref:NmrA family NAD(P)-binding protein n=1 Tax=Flavobacterium silvaticum TaxID=1852020 RepID=A0A972FP52_9FLAO|nr:NAD(P)H-binding protein [Flavobacterium silvaticum]NMH26839.1 NmrA family NAD(P)-binding protein [Flavobacterium silvaticum]
MKIVLTGSLGHISKPLTSILVSHGHDVTVVSSSLDRATEIESLGATAAIGSLEDKEFLAETFSGADSIYTMVPPNDYTNPNLDLLAYYKRLGTNYAYAIAKSGVKKVVNLSTIGAHLEKGSGILLGAHHLAGILDALPSDVIITHLRPTSFYYNLYAYLGSIRHAGMIAVNHGADRVMSWVSPADIAVAAAEELESKSAERKIRYVASDERSGHDIAKILGEAIGKPELKWVLISNAEMEKSLIEKAGIQPAIAAGLTEMWASYQSGLLSSDYDVNKPEVFGSVKFEDFAKEFASVYHLSN